MKLDVVVFDEGDKWIAQCLQHDIAAQGDSEEEVEQLIEVAIKSEMAVCKELGKDFNDIPPAPKYYWDM